MPASHQSPAAAPPCRPGKTAARAPACLVAWRNDEHLSIYRILNNEYTTMKVLACVSLHAVGAATLPMPPARRQLKKLQSNEQGFEPPTCMKSNTVGSCSCSRMASDRSGRPCVRYRWARAWREGGGRCRVTMCVCVWGGGTASARCWLLLLLHNERVGTINTAYTVPATARACHRPAAACAAQSRR